MLTGAQDLTAYLHTPSLSILTPDRVLLRQLMERIAKRASTYHSRIAFAFARPVSWGDGMRFMIQKTSGLGENVNFCLERDGETIADFDIRSFVERNRWSLWHRIVGEDAHDMRFRHQGHGSRVLHSIETYLHSLWMQQGSGEPSHEIVCMTDQEDVQGLLRRLWYTEERSSLSADTSMFHKTIQ